MYNKSNDSYSLFLEQSMVKKASGSFTLGTFDGMEGGKRREKEYAVILKKKKTIENIK